MQISFIISILFLGLTLASGVRAQPTTLGGAPALPARVDSLTGPQGKKIDWRKELTEKLLSLQKPDGSWVSENGRWMEKDPVLVTCYAVSALDLIFARA